MPVMKCEFLAKPCRNFQFLAIDKLVDPQDGREKMVLSNFAAGAVGNVVLCDPVTGEGESFLLPGDEGGEGMLNLDDEKLLVGTSARFGYLHCLDLKTRKWAKPLRDPGETYIWNLCRGSDGMVYGGTFPGGMLLRYDPLQHTLENMGRVSDDPANLYTRHVYGGIPGHILVQCGMNSPHLSLWNIATRQARRFGRPGAHVREITCGFICTTMEGEMDFYDPCSFEPLKRDLSASLTPSEPVPLTGPILSIKLRDGGLSGVRGQQCFYIRKKGARPELQAVPSQRPATRIHTLTADSKGRLWGSSTFGQTIFSYDPATGKEWNSEVVCDAGGEVYGMVFVRGKLFLSAYCGGDHVVYDPSQPWDQIHNLNPRTLQAVGPALIRPSARSVPGPDGHFWTGWMAQYGVHGGGLSRVNTDTLEVTMWYDPVPRQALNGLVADDRYLYFTTTGEANGLPRSPAPCHFAVWDPAGKMVRVITFPSGEQPLAAAAVAGRVLVIIQQQKEIRFFDPKGMRFEGSLVFGETPSIALAFDHNLAVVFSGTQLFLVDPRAAQCKLVGEIPACPTAAVLTPNREIYLAAGVELYRLRP